MVKAIRRWLRRLFKISDHRQKRPAQWPTREEMLTLPVFQGLGFKDIVEVDTPEVSQQAYGELAAAHVVGFDTESRPTFRKGEVSNGPHVVQFSTLTRAYVFTLHDPECRRAAAALIALKSLKKVGFGLANDLSSIRAKLKVEPHNVLDLETLFSQKGYGPGVGVKVGVAMVLNRRFLKSKKASTSNWAQRRLTDKQVLYAANDAYAAMAVYRKLSPK